MSNKMRTLIVAGAALAWATTALAGEQGLYWESTVTRKDGKAQQLKYYAMPKMMKIVGDDGHEIIIRGDQDKFITVDQNNKSYTETKFAEMEEAAKSMKKQMDTAMAQMKDKMKDMPPDQRAMVEKMMKGMQQNKEGAKNVTVKNTGETKTIAGHKATKYVATTDGETVLVSWAASDVPNFTVLRDQWMKLQERLTKSNPMYNKAIVEAQNKIEGFPLETEMGGTKTLVTKVEAHTTPASEFEPPAGYEKKTLQMHEPKHKEAK